MPWTLPFENVFPWCHYKMQFSCQNFRLFSFLFQIFNKIKKPFKTGQFLIKVFPSYKINVINIEILFQIVQKVM